MVRLVEWRDAPQVVPLAARRLGPAHDFEMEQVRRHHAPVQQERAAVDVGCAPAEGDDERGGESPPAVLGKEQRGLAPRYELGEHRAEVAWRHRLDTLANSRAALNTHEVDRALIRVVSDDRDAVLARNANVVAALGLHLREDLVFAGAQVDAQRVARLGEAVGERRRPKAAHKLRQARPARLDPQVADRRVLGLAMALDAVRARRRTLRPRWPHRRAAPALPARNRSSAPARRSTCPRARRRQSRRRLSA